MVLKELYSVGWNAGCVDEWDIVAWWKHWSRALAGLSNC